MNDRQNKSIELPSNRKFGIFFSIVFLFIGWFFSGEQISNISYISFVVAGLFFLITVIKSELLLPLNRFWMWLGLRLGMIMNPIVLGFIFFILFAPISLIMRLFGRDELRLKLKDRKTHWKLRCTNVSQPDVFNNQF